MWRGNGKYEAVRVNIRDCMGQLITGKELEGVLAEIREGVLAEVRAAKSSARFPR